MSTLPIALIVIAVLAVGVAYVLFFRKKALPQTQKAQKKLGEAPSKELAPKPSAPQAVGDGHAAEIAPSGANETSEAAAGEQVEPGALPAVVVVSKKDVAGLRKGLAATRGGFMARLKAIFAGNKEIDPTLLEQMEEVMISSDVGVKTTQAILRRLRDGMAKHELADSDAVWAALRAEATRILTFSGSRGESDKRDERDKPHVILVVGVNGVGKTTTIGKLATKWNADGKKIIFAAGDTFRAAAVQQLEVWGKRVGADIVKGKEGADPGSVAFEATKKAQEVSADVLLVDTAGRLHTKVNLMDEIKKVKRTIAKAMNGAPHETLLVLDATTGQNALTQAALFKEALELTGIILTKLDGTAKGGVILGVCDELKVPVRYIGLGERAEDLREFVVADFVEALFGKGDNESEAA
ncbi:MAG: signal recognition particle-docking protein FtsY [Polyangiaceae bacterium]|nr:signal recognition particle-docking protein FtsY [Polyangiaceae bacterium]